MLSYWYSDVLSLPVPSVFFFFFWGGWGGGFRMMLALLLDVLLCLFLTRFVNTVVSAYVG